MLAFRLARGILSMPGRIAEELAQHRSRTVAAFDSLQRTVLGTHGFTLIELLVVMLVIGLLAAIALPTFLGARAKASDSLAKSLASAAQTAAETFALDHGSSYAAVTKAALNSLDPTIATVAKGNGAYVSKASGTATTYTITATAVTSGDTYTIARAASGIVSRTCTVKSTADRGGCPLATTTKANAAFTW